MVNNMSDKEVALKLFELRFSKYDPLKNEQYYLNVYFEMLEGIENHKSKTIIGKIESLFYDYDNSNHSLYSKEKLIDGIRDIIKGDSNE